MDPLWAVFREPVNDSYGWSRSSTVTFTHHARSNSHSASTTWIAPSKIISAAPRRSREDCCESLPWWVSSRGTSTGTTAILEQDLSVWQAIVGDISSLPILAVLVASGWELSYVFCEGGIVIRLSLIVSVDVIRTILFRVPPLIFLFIRSALHCTVRPGQHHTFIPFSWLGMSLRINSLPPGRNFPCPREWGLLPILPLLGHRIRLLTVFSLYW